MDFSLMEAKMKKNRYATLEEFAADYGLVCSNCKFFNNPQSEYWNQADMMEKYGAGCLEQARDEVDTSVPPNAKWSASGAAAAADDKSNTAMPAAQSYTDLQQLQAAGAGSSGPISYGLPKPGSRAAQIASSSLLFEASAFQNQNAFNPHLYPTIPPGMVAQQGGFTHPGSLPESKDYWAAAPYPPYHPQSQLGLAFSANLSNNLQAGGAGAGGQQMKGKLKNAWQQRPPAAKMVKRDIRLLSGPGVENNFGLPAVSGAATVMDWITLWEREQEVWKQTGRNAVVREEQDGYNSLGPLSYADYKPSASHLNFDGRYLDRIVKFVRQGVVGDAAQVIPTSAATQVHLPNPSTTASLYTHLLKDSCIHRALASKIDGIQTDPLQQQMKAGPKDYVPTALATALPKAHPVALKTGEPMGISVNDVQNIRSLMQVSGDLTLCGIDLKLSV
jgi:hypothetical protein